MTGPGPQPLQTRKEEEAEVPFIPPDILEERRLEKIPSSLHTIKAYRFRPSKNSWKHALTSGLEVDPGKERALEEKKAPCTQLRIITWNVDMVSDHAEDRLTAALRHIEEEVLKGKEGEAPEPCCILLQEVRASLLPYLLRDEWVRRWFVVTPFTQDKWPEGAYYGCVTLIARSLNIAECDILHYGVTTMQRTALCVKVKLQFPGTQEKAVISIVNTHLESLPEGSMARPIQLEMCSRFLRVEGVQGGVIAGDMNAIGPEDAMIGKDLGLRDSWRKGETDAGKTWGYQGQNTGNFPANRLDKIFYLPAMGYKVDEPKRIGVGLKVKESSNQALWVSDHYGLETTLRMLKPRSNSS
ncbi:hypothetical protein GALMADRAFT_247529 [Galerina marginata CBS 339.88]|uniref:Endonuclease/exonuclease/phosphatase domain-containing protein n=1 Tax=Galerina marginata (strain CBS 339.88) TaxID=685588 RepID=A0A067T1M8_GALM3|nr:hypothetical protein GALMADRAFT_247529 [Galerina marginata CBS 339.88]